MTDSHPPERPARVPISFLIPIKNEAENLPRCLDAIRWADEVLVVDSQSTDASAQIAAERGAAVVQFHFNGLWPKKKNWALENLPFRHEWVFILDADEVLPPEAEEEFRAIVTQAGGANGYWINRRFMFMGRWLRHAYYPNWNLRLFRHRLGRYEKLTDAATHSGDNEVHEHVIVQGETGRLQVEMDHFAFPSVEVFVEKHNRYSNWEARVALDGFLRASEKRLQQGHTGLRRRLKQLSQRLPARGLLRFLYVYVGQRGFLDGPEGYYFARLHGFYEFLSVTKTYELRKQAAGETEVAGSYARRAVQFAFLFGLSGILYFALKPVRGANRLHELPAPLGAWLNRHDDLANFSVYLVFALITFALRGSGQKAVLATRLALLLGLVIGVEVAQLFIPGRVASLRDVATGSAGVLIGLALVLAWRRRGRNPEKLPVA